MTLTLDLKRLASAGQLELPIPASLAKSWADHLHLSTRGPIDLRLEYRFSEQGLFLTGELTGSVTGHCSRCHQATEREVALQVRARYLEGAEPKLGERRQDEDGRWGIELDEEAGELEYYSGHHLDLSHWLRDEWALGLPVSLHCGGEACREGAAEGEEPEQPIDPRWQFLADLKAQMEEG
tara:strand:- start:1501 stop:2043 length:543 start_codon:yes stop_codon:yes gene_type:complete